MKLCTLSEAKKALRIDHADDDVTLSLLIEAASEAIAAYLKVDELDDVPSRVKLAAIYLVGKLYDSRDEDDFDDTTLPAVVLSLLHSIRMPTIA